MTLTIDDFVERFSFFELAYLLSHVDSPTAARSRELFGIPEAPVDSDIFLGGLSGLSARNLVSEGPRPAPTGHAALVGHSLATATRWASVAIRTPSQVDVSVLVQGELASFIAQQAPGLVLGFTPLAPDATIAIATEKLAERVLDSSDEAAVLVRVASLDADTALCVVRKHGGWFIARNPVFPGSDEWPSPNAEFVAIGRDEALAEISAAFTL